MADKLAIVTGASTGIGFELAHLAAEAGYDLVVGADEPLIDAAASDFRAKGVTVEPSEADLATLEGVNRLLDAANGRGKSTCSALMPARELAAPFSSRMSRPGATRSTPM